MSRYLRLILVAGIAIVFVACPSTPKPPENTVAVPTFSPAEGSYTEAQAVTITTSTEGAEIRYTTDSSQPTASTGTVYSGPVPVSSTTTIEAIATKKGFKDSDVASATFTIRVADIQFSPAGGSFNAATSVALSTATRDARIFFTTDGSEPSAEKGTAYSGPISVETTTTLRAVGVKQGLSSSTVASATYTIGVPVEPVTDEEVAAAQNAIARAREVDADYYDPANFDAARRLLDSALGVRSSDPASARVQLAQSKEKADLSFDNSVVRSAEDLAARMAALRQKLLDLQADKYMPEQFTSSTAGIDEAKNLFAQKDYAAARARSWQALREMADLRDRLETRLQSLAALRFNVEQDMKEAESTNAYSYAPAQEDRVTTLYLQGLRAQQGYRLDEAEESFGAALEAAKEVLRIAKAARDAQTADEKAKAEAKRAQVMKALQEASQLTIVTEDGIVVTPKNWTEDDFQKEMDQVQKEQQQQQDAAPGTQSMVIPGGESTVVLAEESTEDLLVQARHLWSLGLREEAAGNYLKAQDYFDEALRYVEVYTSYAVKGVYTVRLIPERRDCLWRIAEYKDIYGDPYQWPRIWRRNRKVIQNPDLIYPGWQLVIPP
ncbi:MAG TPA: chitobiase/beta-hexosaminidase C-terminal domain-containing protein [Spirochaetia bacterium]|nr:chitobiase/beta-hexosaminidase C-terminal domain-containing protein [Spirochaetia bacterium]